MKDREERIQEIYQSLKELVNARISNLEDRFLYLGGAFEQMTNAVKTLKTISLQQQIIIEGLQKQIQDILLNKQ